MGEDEGSRILIITHTHRVKAAQQMALDAGVSDRTDIVTFSTLADHLEIALAQDTIPQHHLLASLLDVEGEVASYLLPEQAA